MNSTKIPNYFGEDYLTAIIEFIEPIIENADEKQKNKLISTISQELSRGNTIGRDILELEQLPPIDPARVNKNGQLAPLLSAHYNFLLSMNFERLFRKSKFEASLQRLSSFASLYLHFTAPKYVIPFVPIMIRYLAVKAKDFQMSFDAEMFCKIYFPKYEIDFTQSDYTYGLFIIAGQGMCNEQGDYFQDPKELLEYWVL